MKPSLFHGIYLSLIALSTFLYFTKRNRTDALYEHLGDSLTHSASALSKLSEGAYKAVEVNVEIQPQYGKYLQLAKFIDSTTENFIAELDKSSNQSSINKDSCEHFQKRIYHYITKNIDVYDTSDLLKKSTLNYLLKQNNFWNNTSKISNAGLAAKVNTIKNNAILNKSHLINYCLDRSSGGCCFCGNFPMTSILLRRISVIEDDSVFADIFYGVRLTKSEEREVYANGELLKTKNGTSLIKIENLKKGEHKIDLYTTVRNYTTAKFDTIRDVFHYEVLPKCGRNCAKNQ